MKQTEVMQKLIRMISTGTWEPGDKLPSVRVLSDQFGASPSTVAQSIKEIAQRGYVERLPRKGVFVNDREQWGIRCTGNTSKLIGIMLSDINPSISVLEPFFIRAGYELLIRHSNNNLDMALSGIEEWRSLGARGIIWSPLSTPDHMEASERLADAIIASGIPSVAVDRYPQTREMNSVVSNNAQAGYILTRYMLNMGHRRIGLLRHRYGSTPDDRHAGYRRGLKEFGVKEDESLVFTVPHDISMPELIKGIQNWLVTTKPTAAWSITGNPLGQALLSAAQYAGIKVPEELSVATFDDLIAPFHITRIVQPFDRIMERAASFLLGKIRDESSETHRIVIDSRFEEGESCLPPADQ